MIAQINSRYIRTRPGRLFPRLLSYFFFEGRPATTSGRWFNPVTFASLKRFSRAEIDPCAESPVFITGTGRSGTTVLGIILSINPEIGFLNEPKALWHQVHPNDDLIGSYSETPGRYLLGPEDATQERARKVKAMYSSFLHLIGGTVVVDKYPEMIFRTSYLEKLFKNPRYIFLHRNPYDTIASTAEWSAQHGNSTEDWWGISKRKWHLLVNEIVPADADLSSFSKEIHGLTSQTDLAAVEWIATMNRAMTEEQNRPDAFFRLGYEDLVNNPREKLNQLCSFAGLAADSKMLDYGERMLKARHRENNLSISPFLMEPLARTAARLGYTI